MVTMGRIETALFLTRDDVLEFHKNKPFEEIEITHFRGGFKQFHEQPFVIFVDKDMRTRLFKNRYGHDGEVKN